MELRTYQEAVKTTGEILKGIKAAPAESGETKLLTKRSQEMNVIEETKWLLTHNEVEAMNEFGMREKYWVTLDGKKNGEFKSWHKNGELFEHAFYKNDRYHGEFKSWNNSGDRFENFNYKDGMPIGEQKSWHSNGQLFEHYIFEDGKLVWDKMWDVDGSAVVTEDGKVDIPNFFKNNEDNEEIDEDIHSFFEEE